MFTRGLTLVFYEDYPSEAEMYKKLSNEEPIELDWHFWAYMAIFLSMFLFASVWQFSREEKEHDELEKYERA